MFPAYRSWRTVLQWTAPVMGFALLLPVGTADAASSFRQCGSASWYELGGRTASGEPADPSGLSAAHRTLPFGTHVRVKNLHNAREVVVRINDRGPFVRDRVIDVTRKAAEELGFVRRGVTRVKITALDNPGEHSGGFACPSG